MTYVKLGVITKLGVLIQCLNQRHKFSVQLYAMRELQPATDQIPYV